MEQVIEVDKRHAWYGTSSFWVVYELRGGDGPISLVWNLYRLVKSMDGSSRLRDYRTV